MPEVNLGAIQSYQLKQPAWISGGYAALTPAELARHPERQAVPNLLPILPGRAWVSAGQDHAGKGIYFDKGETVVVAGKLDPRLALAQDKPQMRKLPGPSQLKDEYKDLPYGVRKKIRRWPRRDDLKPEPALGVFLGHRQPPDGAGWLELDAEGEGVKSWKSYYLDSTPRAPLSYSHWDGDAWISWLPDSALAPATQAPGAFMLMPNGNARLFCNFQRRNPSGVPAAFLDALRGVPDVLPGF